MSVAAAPEKLDVAALRRHYPALDNLVEGKRLVYLDNACTALKSRRVAERLSEFYLNRGVCGGKRSTHLLSRQVEAELTEARTDGSNNAQRMAITLTTTSNSTSVKPRPDWKKYLPIWAN